MTEWLAGLKGQDVDLNKLTALFRSPDLNIRQEEHSYWLRSLSFSTLIEAQDVLSTARETVERVNGAASIFLPEYRPVDVGGITRIDQDGRNHQYIFPSSLNLQIVLGRPIVFVEGGSPPPSPPSEPELATLYAQTNPQVAKALRIFSREHTWDNLYKIFEIVQSDTGNTIFTRGWVSKKQASRFEHTANSVTAIGDAARHGVERHQPPHNPMTQTEAISFVRGLLAAWLRSKQSSM